jgi:DNA-directed RNA polymerase subunit RPC12/RpoP
MKPLMFILARILGEKHIGSGLYANNEQVICTMYYWHKKYWVWKMEQKTTYICRNCDRTIDEREYNARDGVCQRCWGQVD